MDKTLSLQELVAELAEGQLLAFGGGGLDRKPMAAVRAIATSAIKGIHLAAFLGGPDADLLIGLGKVLSLRFAYVGFDRLGLAPNFRAARESGKLHAIEYSEGLALAGLEAAAKRLPFIPAKFGLGTDVLNTPTSPFKVFPCPITGEELVAVPAITPDVAIIHVNLADRRGNGHIAGDGYADALLARAAKRVYLTAERVVDELPKGDARRATVISRLWVSGVCEVSGGAKLTACFPDYPADVRSVLAYQARATKTEWLQNFASTGEVGQ